MFLIDVVVDVDIDIFLLSISHPIPLGIHFKQFYLVLLQRLIPLTVIVHMIITNIINSNSFTHTEDEDSEEDEDEELPSYLREQSSDEEDAALYSKNKLNKKGTKTTVCMMEILKEFQF